MPSLRNQVFKAVLSSNPKQVQTCRGKLETLVNAAQPLIPEKDQGVVASVEAHRVTLSISLKQLHGKFFGEERLRKRHYKQIQLLTFKPLLALPVPKSKKEETSG